MVKAMVIVSPIAILLAVCLIVFLIETNAVAQGKTVVRRHRLMVADGRLPSRLKRSLEPAKRPANSPATDRASARSGGRHRESGRSTRQTAAGSSPPDNRPRRCPVAPQSASPLKAPGSFDGLKQRRLLAERRVRPITGAGRSENRPRGTSQPSISGTRTRNA